MTGLLGRLMVVAEAYPQLRPTTISASCKASSAVSRPNCSLPGVTTTPPARELNTKVVSFPDMLFAGPLGFKEEPYYEDADASIQSAPKVEFQRP
jgi:LemA protein